MKSASPKVKARDIARLAGVSPATVTRVFANQPNVSPEIRDRVLRLAEKNGFTPKIPAGRKNVVIILPDSEIYPIRNCLEMVMMALTLELPKRGFHLEILPQSNLDRLDNLQFCGAVAIGAEPADFRTWAARFTVPLVLIDRAVPADWKNVYAVHSDEEQGMRLALEYLHAHGCRKIGCIIHGQAGTGNADIRRAAVLHTLAELGLPAQDSLVRLGDDESYVENTGRLLRLGIDGLFCPGGNAGMIAAYALSLFDKRVPDDISLITSENKLFSRFATPPQTTITQDHHALATIAADILEGKAANPLPVLNYQLIVRESVAEGAGAGVNG